jgi:hypothetical protein
VRAIRLRPRDRRALVAGAAAIACAVLFPVAVRPYLETRVATTEQLALQRSLLAREVALLAESAGYPALMDRAEEVLRAAAPRLLPGADEVTATARLAAYLADQARRSRILLQQSEGRDAERLADDVLAVQVELRAIGDLEGILSFLHGLEAGEKLVRVERLAIERLDRGMGQGGGGSEPLAMAATVRGFAVSHGRQRDPESADADEAVGEAR